MTVVVVPMDVRALVVGHPDSARDDAYVRMGYAFEELERIAAGERLPYLGESITPDPGEMLGQQEMPAGVHLHWAVPAALAHSRVEEGATAVKFSPAPNRWLVVRIGATADHKTVLDGWIVASDRLWDPGPSTSVDAANLRSRPAPITPSDDNPKKVTRRLGQVTPLGQFAEQSGADAAHHSVVGYGITTFAAAAQHAPNVFGMWDGLDDGATELSALSYLVAGWHSKRGKDPVKRVKIGPDATLASALADATGWQFAAVDGADPPARSIYAGVVTGVANDLDKAYCRSHVATDKGLSQLDVAVGSTAPEALAALLANGDPDAAQLEQALTLLQQGLLPQLTAAGGASVCEALLHASRFAAVPAGTQWQVTRVPTGTPGEAVTSADLAATAQDARAPLPSALAGALGELNRAQAEVDALTHTVASARSQLFADWCKYVEVALRRETALDVTSASRLLQATVDDLDATAHDLTLKKSPLKDKRDALAGHATEAGYTLSPTPAPRFWQPVDPVVVLRGDDVVRPDRTGRNGAKGFPFPLTTRLAQSLTGSLAVGGGQLAAGDVPALDLKATPFAAELTALLVETVLLDPGQAPALAQRLATRVGTQAGTLQPDVAAAQQRARANVPALGFATWEPPWIPLLLSWQVTFAPDADADTAKGDYPTGLLTGGYTLHRDTGELVRAAAGTDEGLVYSGSALLASGVTLALRGQIDEYVKTYPDDPLKPELLALEQRLRPPTPEYPDGQPMLAQALNGLGASLLMRRQTLQLPVHDPFAQDPDFAAAVAAHVNPAPGAVHNDLAALPNSPYAPLRAGTARFTTELRLVDAFGQYREIPVGDCVQAASVVPPGTQDPAALWLPPRLQQGARLMLRWLDARDDATESVDAVTSPVCGWVLFNHIEDSLAIYDADGTPLGSLGADGPIWRSAPRDAATLADTAEERLDGANPHLSAFATSIASDPPRTAFLSDLLATIDATLTNVATATAIGSGSTAALVGRPLVLVRAAIDLELIGAPALDQSWPALVAASDAYQKLSPDSGTGGIVRDSAGFPAVDVPVTLGDPDAPHDGLIGFFVGDSYDRFFAPAAVDNDNGVRVAGPKDLTVSAGGGPVLLTLLIDPTQAVHAATGVLPRKDITLPPSMYADVLRTLRVMFTVTPAITSASAATVPVPPEPGFDWSWLTLADDGHGAATLDTTALGIAATSVGGPPAEAADGWLSLQPKQPDSTGGS